MTHTTTVLTDYAQISVQFQQRTETATDNHTDLLADAVFIIFTMSARVPLCCKILGWRLELTVRPFNL